MLRKQCNAQKAEAAPWVGEVAKTRKLRLYAPANTLAGGCDLVGIEDVNVKPMSNKQRRQRRTQHRR